MILHIRLLFTMALFEVLPMVPLVILPMVPLVANGTIGLPMVPMVPLGEQMVPLALQLVDQLANLYSVILR